MKSNSCSHVKADGNVCQAPRLKNQEFCYFHMAARDRIRRQRQAAERNLPLQIPVLEDRQTIQLALGDVANAILADRIDPRKAALVLYALQTASANANRLRFATGKQWYEDYNPKYYSGLPELPAETENVPKKPPQSATESAPVIPSEERAQS